MGLLLGTMDDVDQDKLNVLSLKMIRRLTKQKDRVEIDNIYLTQASEHAEQLGLRVLGWYHSHPHITVHPSHVDLATQLGYQYMDSNFVGLIFSVFNYDPTTGVDTKEVTEAHEDLASASIEQLKIERELLKKLIEEMN